MTYARSRLWLGITGVGSLVILTTLALCFDLPNRWLSNSTEPFGFGHLLQIAGVVAALMAWMAPLDFLGGYFLPKRYGKTEQSFGHWFKGYVSAATMQAALFMLFGTCIILASRQLGLLGGLSFICLATVGCFFVRNLGVRFRESKTAPKEKLLDAISLIQSWEIFVPTILVVDHSDRGFTGGIIGVGKKAKIVIPRGWLDFTREQLATVIARRAVAIESGSYARGLVFAFLWNVAGFVLCAVLWGSGLSNVAGLVATGCGFTLWSFLGLLILPTISRNASLSIDQSLVAQGMPATFIESAAHSMDQLQDGEPDRPGIIETIFHPVPNVTSRNQKAPSSIGAWNVARTTLFFSWACLGFLSRSVHCNVGRPELWTMLPTD